MQKEIFRVIGSNLVVIIFFTLVLRFTSIVRGDKLDFLISSAGVTTLVLIPVNLVISLFLFAIANKKYGKAFLVAIAFCLLLFILLMIISRQMETPQ
jgi:hypothetical protein